MKRNKKATITITCLGINVFLWSMIANFFFRPVSFNAFNTTLLVLLIIAIVIIGIWWYLENH
jgi:uncharacterized membrane-anchored protein